MNGDSAHIATEDLVVVPRSELDTLRDELAWIRRRIGLVLSAGPEAGRKYTTREVGYRLVTGRDPATMTEGELGKIEPISERTVDRLAAAGFLPKMKLGGSTYYTEAAVRSYESRMARGEVEGFRVVRKIRSKRKST